MARSAVEAPEAPRDADEGGSGAGQMMHVEEDVVRDLRHSAGNHFHKLFYWVDRIGSEEDASARAKQAEEMSGVLQRFQEFLELGLRYFEADKASPMTMSAPDVAAASESLLQTELPEREVTVTVDESAAGTMVSLDPQRFSLALRLVANLMGGANRESFSCTLALCDDADSVEFLLDATGGEAPLEIAVMEWAIARKLIVMQGGALRTSSRQQDEIGGCVVRLALGK
ncbi:MAG: hypothetical protein P8R42_15540 [Candidatus Binatia bacterium]|nr:hypothetical protein [Candidatus Binatia bacterium]